MLIPAFRCPDQIVRLIKNTGLPLEAKETFIRQNIAIGKIVDHGFCRQTFIQIGWH